MKWWPCWVMILGATLGHAGIQDLTYYSDLNKRDVSIKVYTPPGYEAGNERYPVVYNLHGAGGGSPERQWDRTSRTLTAAMEGRKVRPMIYVFVNGLGDTFFIDYADGSIRAESSIIQELIPFIDKNFRTIASREGRAVDGFSMGGCGCLMLAFKYPDLFSSVVSYGAAVIGEERITFGGKSRWASKEHFDQFSPWSLVRKNADAIREKVRVRMVCGDKDGLFAANVKFKALLDELKIPVDWVPVAGVAHDTKGLYVRVGVESLKFIEAGFAAAGKESAESDNPTTGPFRHPGIALSRAELDFIKAKVRAGEQPWKAGWEKMRSWEGAALAWTPKPHAHVERGSNARPNIGGGELQDDAQAAYAHALQWYVTGHEEHAKKAIEIMNVWASQLKTITNSDAKLLCGMTGHIWCNAAEIIRHTYSGWSAADQERFRSMLLNIYWPIMKGFKPNYNGNWDASMINSIMAIGVFCDDRVKFDYAVEYFCNGKGNGSIAHYVGPTGQCQETSRDQTHTQMGLGYLACACEIAWHQGLDLWGALDNRLAQGFEYEARVQMGLPVPFEGRGQLSTRGVGRLAPIYEMVYNHYHNRAGLPMTHVKDIVAKGRPEGFNRSFLSWGTLTHAEMGGLEKNPKAKKVRVIVRPDDPPVGERRG